MVLSDLKIKVHNKCIEKQKDIMDSAFNAMEEAQNAANEYGPPKDRYDSFRTQLLRKRDMHAEQYQKALKDLDYLKKLSPESITSVVAINSLVKTNNQIFYITIGLGKLEVENQSIYVISPVTPIYKALEGKKAGDSMLFNGQKLEIIGVV